MTLKNNWASGDTFAASDQNAVATQVNANTAAVPQYGALASRPAAGNAGALYFCSDVDTAFRDNGTSWVRIRIGDGAPLGDVPTTGWTPAGLVAGSTWAQDLDGMLFTAASAAAHNVAAQLRTYPGTPFTLKAYIEGSVSAVGTTTNGSLVPGITISDGTKLIHWGHQLLNLSGTVGNNLLVYQFTNSSTFSSQPLNIPGAALRSIPKWFAYVDDGTNAKFQYSFNGLDWLTAFTQARAAFLTPTKIGIGVENYIGLTGLVRVRSWSGVS